MTWNRSLILASGILNVLTLVLPGGYLIGVWTVDTISTSQLSDELLALVTGVVMTAYGLCNIACIATARAEEGRAKKTAIVVGYLSCGVLVFAGFMVSKAIETALPPFLYVATAVTMAWAILLTHLPSPREGLCEHCGYDLAGLPGDVCPECGKRQKEGRCKSCGYDLAGFSGDVCPECGEGGDGRA